MSTTHGQPGLSSDQRSTIRSTILSTRRTLEDELRRQLEKYGIYEDNKLQRNQLTHLSVEELHTRDRIDAAIKRELESTEGDLERSISNYVREATKTYLNRFVALKTIEVRGLVEETLTERPEYGNRSYMHHTVAEIGGELTNAPDDGFGAALDLAYQEIGAEIRMIFEESEHTAIDLDAQVQEEVLDELDAIDDDAWESDEALGWVYQYFGEEEREEIDERVDEENYKIAGTDIATKTQLFTPRYIVEWMVDNSLGRLWIEMQDGRTNINDEDNCFYLAPLEDSLTDRETKPVKDITVLDPACGSGHMLFYAFDVLYQMYLEESEVPEKYIPREILQNNLYGVDIDSGAAQIAALSLYLKAKEKSPDVVIPGLNVVSADAVLINGNRKQEILGRAQSELEEEVLTRIWTLFENVREWGSLIQVGEKIEDILDEYRDLFESKGQTQFTQEGDLTSQSTFISSQEEETWDELRSRLMDNVHEMAREALEQDDPVEEMFANEVEKSVRLVDLFREDYDVLVTNPPYLGSGKMGDELKEFVRSNYVGSRDLYAAFIERSISFVKSDGYASLVTPENFMFLSSYTKLRSKIIQDTQFIEGAHLSRYGFDQQKDAYTIPFVLRNTDPTEFATSRFYRMTEDQVDYETYEDKITGLSEITVSNRNNTDHRDVYVVDQNSFKSIDRHPFVYWLGEDILTIFDKYVGLGESDVSKISGGVKSGDNTHFLRKAWEIPNEWVNDNYRWFVKGGEGNDYYDKINTLIRWEEGGQNIIDYCNKHGKNYQGLSDPSWYEDESIIFRDFSNIFVAKYLPSDTVFSSAVYRIKMKADISERYLLGYLNSNLYRYIADAINPSLHFKPGDAGAVPINTEIDSQSEELIGELAGKCVDKRKKIFQHVETGREFDGESLNSLLSEDLMKGLFTKEMLLSDILIIHGEIDERIYDIHDITDEAIEDIEESFHSNLKRYPHITNIGDINASEEDIRDEIPKKELPEEEYRELIKEIESRSDGSIRDISEELEISPYSVAIARFEHDLYSNSEKAEAAGEIMSYYLGCALGHWNHPNFESDGDEILTFNGEVMDYIRDYIKHSVGENSVSEREAELEEALGKSVDDWLRNRFFRYHHTKEYRRRGQRIPIYWQLESPNGAFSCFVYYHGIDTNTLPKLRGQYLDPRINELENELETLTAQTSGANPDKELLKRKEEVQNDLEDVREFRETIDEMIDDGVTVDVEKGIWENIKEWDQYEVLETGLPKLKSSYSR